MKNEKKSLSKEDRFTQLGWCLLELKCQYYRPELVHTSYKHLIVPDAVYDKLEAEYRSLASELGKQPYTADAVDFPFERASARLVAEKLGKVGNRLVFDFV